MKLYPSILTAQLDIYQQQISLVQSHGQIKVVQVDVIDGCFADNLTLSPLDLTHIDYDHLQLDFHLMVEEPLDFVQEITALKEYLPIRGIIAQVERLSSQSELLELIVKHAWQAGLSLDFHTPLSAIDQRSWSQLDILQLMTIEAGFQGQEFCPRPLSKLNDVHQENREQVEIIVDGGVKLDQVKQLADQGVHAASVGSGIWQADDPHQAMTDYLQAMTDSSSD